MPEDCKLKNKLKVADPTQRQLTIHYTENFHITYLIRTIYGKLLHKTPEIVCPKHAWRLLYIRIIFKFKTLSGNFDILLKIFSNC
jgi:hypothetical protein